MSEEDNNKKEEMNEKILTDDVKLFVKGSTSTEKNIKNSSVSQLFNTKKTNENNEKYVVDAKKVVVDNVKDGYEMRQDRYKGEEKSNVIIKNQKDNNLKKDSNNKNKKIDENVILNLVSILFHLMLNVIFYIVVIYAVTFIAHKAYDFSYQIYGDVTVDEEPGKNISFTVSSGESSERVAQNLKDSNLIKNKTAFLIRLKLCGKSVYPDEYTLSTSMNYNEIIERICSDGVQSAE